MEIGMTKLQAAVFAEITAAIKNTNDRRHYSSNPPHQSTPAILRQRSPVQENSAHLALLDVAHAFTPRVEDTAADTLLLDLAGLERLYGTVRQMGNDLAECITAVGIEANVAIAATPDAAMHAARGFNGISIIPPGKEVATPGSSACAGIAWTLLRSLRQTTVENLWHARGKSCANRC